MLILSVESTCDETAVSVILNGREILSDEMLSQADIHAIYGGVVPEIASRAHVEAISQLAETALKTAGVSKRDLDAVAAAYAPGLIGALLVGVNFAKAAAFGLGVPFVPVHHIRGHIAANYIAYPELSPPFLALVISGGHSLIAEVLDYTSFRLVGSSRDDAVGECFDKVARVMGLGYPGGRELDALARTGDDAMYPLPRASVENHPYDMSFSGLKTSVINIVHNASQTGRAIDKHSLAASFESAVSDALIPRITGAALELGYRKIAVAGGVAANTRLRRDLEIACSANGLSLFLPPLRLCGDNAAMIGCQGYYELLAGNTGGLDTNAYANMELDRTHISG